MTLRAQGPRLILPALLVLAAAVSSCAAPPNPSVAAGSDMPAPTTSGPMDDHARAIDLADRYERAIASGDAAAAWSLAAPADRVRWGSLQAFADERAAFTASTQGAFSLGEAKSDPAEIAFWKPADAGASLDASRAFVIEVDFPRIGDNNSGYEILMVAPDATGSWWVWVVR